MTCAEDASIGIDTWVELELWAKGQRDWFRKFLSLPNGIPSHDTFGRVFSALDPEAFGRCFTAWTGAVARLAEGEVVAIDGKTVRRSFDRASGKSAIHVVSAWASQNRLVLGQVKTEEKSNETLWMDTACREWEGLTSFGKVESERTLDGVTTHETRYIISSLPETDPARFLQAVRTHWTVENELHWSLDMTFGEDDSRVRKDHAPENMAVLRRLALSLLRQHDTVHVAGKSRKLSLNLKRKIGAWNPAYLLQWLGFSKPQP